jgi:hypothetical protein
MGAIIGASISGNFYSWDFFLLTSTIGGVRKYKRARKLLVLSDREKR